MIDISSYQQRLELAKEWMFHKIDGTLPMIGNKGVVLFIVDIGYPPRVSWEEAMIAYEQCGVLYWNSNIPSDMRPVTIEEYCEYNLNKFN